MEEDRQAREARAVNEAKQKQEHFHLFLEDLKRYYEAAANPNEIQITPDAFITQEYDL